ncbi:uncharacterized protein LOC142230161 [Haematobia irritans]|uniref:uncharacterized protein LOC142230161 n=1 Tax=Haematobia irritans TaxID=7368 RepID=UPI003F500AA4
MKNWQKLGKFLFDQAFHLTFASNRVATSARVAFNNRGGEYLACVFLDIKGAFDNVNDGDTLHCRSFTRTPQVSVMSPLSFNVYINEIFDNGNVGILAYADDLVMFYAHENLGQAISELQSAVDIVNQKLRQMELKLSPQKSKAMIFPPSRKKSPTASRSIIIEDTPLEYVQTFKFLGYTFDPNLSIRQHDKEIQGSCAKILNILRALCGVSWGADPQNLLILYKGVIRPKIE